MSDRPINNTPQIELDRDFVNKTILPSLKEEYCDIRSVASSLRAGNVITPSDLEKLDYIQTVREANGYFYQIIDRDPSIDKLRALCKALKKDTTIQHHQEMASKIYTFMQSKLHC